MIEMMFSNSGKKLKGLQAAFVLPGTYTWIVPKDVTSISAVAVGAGGGGWDRRTNNTTWGSSGCGGSLRYRVSIPVTPGEKLTIVVGAGGGNTSNGQAPNGGASSIKRGSTVLVQGNGGTGGGSTDSSNITNSTAGGIGDGGGNGGSGISWWQYAGGGGGAGGYSGNGGKGNAAEWAGTNGSGGGGGGGYGNPRRDNIIIGRGGRGGGVGIMGLGNNGLGAGFNQNTAGGDGSQYPDSGSFGGGASAPSNGLVPINAQGGAVRIVWGTGRNYPNYVPDA